MFLPNNNLVLWKQFWKKKKKCQCASVNQTGPVWDNSSSPAGVSFTWQQPYFDFKHSLPYLPELHLCLQSCQGNCAHKHTQHQHWHICICIYYRGHGNKCVQLYCKKKKKGQCKKCSNCLPPLSLLPLCIYSILLCYSFILWNTSLFLILKPM